MEIEQAKKIASELWNFPVEIQKGSFGIRILREMTEAEKKLTADGRTFQVTRDGKVLMGAGPSIRVAMRYAAKPRIDEIEKLKAERQGRLRREEQDAQVRLNQFQDFLLEKYSDEFEKWLAGKTESANGPTGDQPAAAPAKQLVEAPSNSPDPGK